jgi:hypothetical protein
MAARFNPPPNWPISRQFTPAPGWQPDPGWGPAPPGWQFWIDEPAGMPTGSAAAAVPPPGQEPRKKAWYKRWWVIAVAAVVVVAIATTSSRGDKKDAGASPDTRDQGDSQPQSSGAETESSPAPEPEPVGFGDGTYRIGSDMPPGTYRSSDDASLCYWARLTGFGGSLDEIIANGNSGPEIVAIDPSDAGFETQGCGEWLPLESSYPDAPATSFGDGTFHVGHHIAPGSYRASGAPGDLCYWARLSDFSHAGVNGIIANGNSPTIVDIAPTDVGFTSFGCGDWTQ